jgi:hypothetical protein
LLFDTFSNSRILKPKVSAPFWIACSLDAVIIVGIDNLVVTCTSHSVAGLETHEKFWKVLWCVSAPLPRFDLVAVDILESLAGDLCTYVVLKSGLVALGP